MDFLYFLSADDIQCISSSWILYSELWSHLFLHTDHLHLDISLASQIRTITTIIFPFISSLPVHNSHLGLSPRVPLNAHPSVLTPQHLFQHINLGLLHEWTCDSAMV